MAIRLAADFAGFISTALGVTAVAAVLAVGAAPSFEKAFTGVLAADDMTYGGFLGLKLWLFVVGMISAFLHGTHDAAASAMPRWWWLPGFALAAFLTYVFHDPAPLLWLAAFAALFCGLLDMFHDFRILVHVFV